MNKTATAQPTKITNSLKPAQSLLQRNCACGNHTVTGGECAECAKKKTGLQRKLAIGASNDPLEHEANRIAEQVMSTPLNSAVNATPPRIQRLSGQTDESTNTAPASVDRVLADLGRPLEPSLRLDMEQRFGHDFSQVRIHTGSAAAQSARDVNAHAYTAGNNIVFGAGRFSPTSQHGRQLIAHELAHTIQQGASKTTLQRRTDYDIIGINPNAASDPSSIYFNLGSAAVSAREQTKIKALAKPANRALTLLGYASEEGSVASRTAMTGRRLAAVENALVSAGHTGSRTLTPEIARGEGQINYRNMRAVEVVPTPIAGPVISSHGSGVCTQAEPCGTAFTTALPVAVTQLNTAIAEVTTGTAAATAQLATLFPGVPTAQVLRGLNGLASELVHMATNHWCHNNCDPRCERSGYANPSSRMMTLCPGFLHNASVPENALLLLHEGLHMVPGLTTVDSAYRHSRFIDFIPGAQAATNTDSFVLLIIRLSGGAASGPPADNFSSLTPVDQKAAKRALAFMEQWLLTCDWNTSQLYESIKVNKGRVGGWDPAHNFHAGTQHVIGWIFGLTDPGPVPPYTTAPTQSDQEKVAGIHDRYNRFMHTVWARKITVTQSAAGPDTWAANLGQSVVVTPAFFQLSNSADQVLRLIELMAGSLPPADVPVARQRHYAIAAQQMWWHSGRVGP